MSTEDEDLTAGEYMTLEQVAAYVGRRRDTVSQWLSRFDVPRELMCKTEDVVAARASMPGRGNGGGRPRSERTNA